MSVTVKIVNTTAALQTLLLTGDQPLPVPPTDHGVSNTFDLDRDDDRMQAERLHKALSLPSIKQQIARGELKVEGFDELEAALGISKRPKAATEPKKQEQKVEPKVEQKAATEPKT